MGGVRSLRATVLLVGLAGCFWYTEPFFTVGTLQTLWTFNGGLGCNAAGVDRVVVNVSGFSFSFFCYDPVSGVAGATLHNVSAGLQSLRITGFSGPVAVYQWVGTALVHGGAFNSYRYDLPLINPAPPAQSDVTFLWTFAGRSCRQAGIGSVNIAVQDPIGGNVNSTQPCTQQNVDGAVVRYFAAGTYPFTLTGLNGFGQPAYRAAGAATVNGFTPITVRADLQPGNQPVIGFGGAAVTLTFAGRTCARLGLTQIYADLRDLNGVVVSQTTVPCAGFNSTVSFTQMTAPATYYLDVEGSASQADGGSAVLYQLIGEGLTVQPNTTSSYAIDVPPA